MTIDSLEQVKQNKRKRAIRVTFLIFLGGMLLFSLFSNTLENLTLPKAMTEKVAIGSLDIKLEGSGVLRPVAEAKLANTNGWKVQSILVQEGDRVKKGQTLITYDYSSAERELQDEEVSYKKKNMELEQIQQQYIQATTEGDEITRRNALRDMESHKLDQSVQQRKIDEFRARIDSSKAVLAPFDGIITQINAVEGLLSTGDSDLLISNQSQGYWFEFTTDSSLLTNMAISVQEKLQVEVLANSEQKATFIDGMVVQISNAEPRMDSQGDQAGSAPMIAQSTIRVEVSHSALKGGEQATVNRMKKTQQEGFIVSKSAVREDREGKYIFKIVEDKGPLGNVYKAKKVYIESYEANGSVAMIEANEVNMDALIIMESSEPLQDGNRVRLQ